MKVNRPMLVVVLNACVTETKETAFASKIFDDLGEVAQRARQPVHLVLRETVSRRDAADFLRRLIEAVPYKVHTVLTDNGTHFTDPAGDSYDQSQMESASRRISS